MTRDNIIHNRIDHKIQTEHADTRVESRLERRLALTVAGLAVADLSCGALLTAAGRIQTDTGTAILLTAFSAALALVVTKRESKAMQQAKVDHCTECAKPNETVTENDLATTLKKKRNHFGLTALITTVRLSSSLTALGIEGLSLWQDPPQIEDQLDMVKLASATLTGTGASLASIGAIISGRTAWRSHRDLRHLQQHEPA